MIGTGMMKKGHQARSWRAAKNERNGASHNIRPKLTNHEFFIIENPSHFGHLAGVADPAFSLFQPEKVGL
jgi:hypothetical protein